MPERNLLGLNLNMDSMAEALGYPSGFRDPTWFQVLDRILNLLEPFSARLTLFVIGKDLEHPDVAARIKDLAAQGHEIANHTYSHRMDLGAMPLPQIKDEITRTHHLIHTLTGSPPRGFLAPAWSTSPAVPGILMELGYSYDCSPFPSLWLFPMVASYAWYLKHDPQRLKPAIRRSDYANPFRASLTPYRAGAGYAPASGRDGIWVLPLPTANRWSPPLWHSTAFLGNAAWFWRRVKELPGRRAPYYLFHPADAFELADFPPEHQGVFWRMKMPLQQKLPLLRRVLETLHAEGASFVTMREVAASLNPQP